MVSKPAAFSASPTSLASLAGLASALALTYAELPITKATRFCAVAGVPSTSGQLKVRPKISRSMAFFFMARSASLDQGQSMRIGPDQDRAPPGLAAAGVRPPAPQGTAPARQPWPF